MALVSGDWVPQLVAEITCQDTLYQWLSTWNGVTINLLSEEEEAHSFHHVAFLPPTNLPNFECNELPDPIHGRKIWGHFSTRNNTSEDRKGWPKMVSSPQINGIHSAVTCTLWMRTLLLTSKCLLTKTVQAHIKDHPSPLCPKLMQNDGFLKIQTQ